MLKIKLSIAVTLAAVMLLGGCSKKIQKPADVSDPNASMAWIADRLAAGLGAGALPEVYEHAGELAAAHPENPDVSAFLNTHQPQLDGIPKNAFSWSIREKKLDTFKWALGNVEEPVATNDELRRIWGMNPEWRNLAEATFSNALPVFMNEAARSMNIHYFEKNIARFKATGFALAPGMSAEEYQRNYIHLLGIELKKATAANDLDRMRTLLNNAPGLDQLPRTKGADRTNMKAFADHVLYEMQSEEFIAKLAELGYPFEGLNLDKLDFDSALVKGMMANPEQAVSLFGLDKAGPPLSRSEARFLLKLPIRELENLHDQHVNEAIEMCMAVGGTDQAIQFIQLKAAQKPLERPDYLQFMSWAIQYDDQKILQLAKKHGGDVRMDELDLNAFASDQKTFERYAPSFMKKVKPVMALSTPEGGLTFGKIRQIIENDNEEAGLYLVKKLDLTDDQWIIVTGEKTLLMEASHAGNLAVAKYLVEKREADVFAATSYSTAQTTLFGSSSAREGKMSAMLYAAKGGHSHIIEYLASQEVDVNSATHYGATALMLATSAGHFDAVQTLLKLGADPNAEMKAAYKDEIYENGMGYAELRTAPARAEALGYEEILATLK